LACAELDHDVTPDLLVTGAGEPQDRGLGQLGAGRDPQDDRAVTVAQGQRGDPVDRLRDVPQQRIVGADRGQLDTDGQVGGPLQMTLGRRAVEQAAKPVQRGEPPVLFPAGGHLEVVDLEARPMQFDGLGPGRWGFSHGSLSGCAATKGQKLSRNARRARHAPRRTSPRTKGSSRQN